MTASEDSTARLWDFVSNDLFQEPRILNNHEAGLFTSPVFYDNAISPVAFSPISRWLVTRSKYCKALLWDLTSGRPATRPVVLNESNNNRVWSVAISLNN